MRVCPDCGQSNPDRFRLCGFCGHELGTREPSEIRRHVTVLFSDLKGFTSMSEKVDSEALFEVLSRYFDAMRVPIERHGGRIEKLIGDAVLAVFGLPRPHPDDPARALRAAAETVAELNRINEDLERAYGLRLTNRTGVATGEVVVGLPRPGERAITGEVLGRAIELEAAAPPMGVLVGESTCRELAVAIPMRPHPLPVPGSGEGSDRGSGAMAWELIAPPEGPDAEEVELAGAPAPGRAGDAHGPAAYCANCGEEAEPGIPRCGTCGSRLDAESDDSETRKVVTFVFADLQARREDGQPLAPDAARELVNRGFAVARDAVERHGGNVEKFVGDALAAVFGVPVLHEDDALRAVRAAVDLRAAVASLDHALAADGLRLSVRIGVNTGLVVAGAATEGFNLVTGDAVNTAARLEQAADDGGILLGESTLALVRESVEVAPAKALSLKGKAQPVPAHPLLRARDAGELVARGGSLLVGRDADLDALGDAFGAATRSGPQLVTLVGEAGIGKSRLVRELAARIQGEAEMYAGRCLAYGEAVTFAPIVEVIRNAAGLRDDEPVEAAEARLRALVGEPEVADRLAALAGLTATPYPLGELFWGVRRLFERLTRDGPVVVVVDGLQWAEPSLIDLLDHLLETLPGSPVLLLCQARPELLEERPDWATGDRSRRLVLAPLSPEDGERLAAALLDEGPALASVRERVVATAQGNPLFIEQLVQVLLERGMVRRGDDGWWALAGSLGELDLPPTIQALLAARIDALPRDEREVVQPASVVGYEFTRPPVDALLDDRLRPVVPEAISSLTARRFVRPDPDRPVEDEAYRFRNQLIRDAAYQGVLKRARVALHEGYVTWADAMARDGARTPESEEALGYHLEQAYRYRTEFGPPDDAALATGRDASARLGSAGRRAFLRGDMHAASALFRRAAALLPSLAANRLALLPELGEALVELGAFDEAEAVLAEAVEASSATGDEALGQRAALIRLLLRMYTGDEADWSRQVDEATTRATSVFSRLGDHDGLARTWRLRFGMLQAACQYGQAHEAGQHVVEEAVLADDPRLVARGAVGVAGAALLGPLPVAVAIDECRRLIDQVANDRRSVGLILCFLGQLEAMSGDADAARTTYREGRRTLEELGRSVLSVSTSANSWRTEMLSGDPAAAEAELRRDWADLDAMGERYVMSTITGALAHVLLAQGRVDEASQYAATAEDLAAPDDVETQALWRSARAKIRARRNEPGALELAAEAVALARGTEAPALLAETLVDLAEVETMGGQRPRAIEVLREALGLAQAKGDVASVGRISATLATIGGR